MLAGNVGDYPTSLEMTGQAREVFARAGDTEMESAALAQQATTLFNMARFAEAQAALEETLPIFRRAGHRYREAIALSNLASIAVMQRTLRHHRQLRHAGASRSVASSGSWRPSPSPPWSWRTVRCSPGASSGRGSCAEEAMAIARTRGQRRAARPRR